MTDAILEAIGFTKHFPAITKPRDDREPWQIDNDKREAHIAQVLPDLIRLYAVTPDKIANAFDEVSMRLVECHPALVASIALRDHAEIGRLLLVGIDARIKELAYDAAEDDGYRVVPERPL